jgi:hypothetical protein
VKHFLNQKKLSWNPIKPVDSPSTGLLHEIIAQLGQALANSQAILDEKWMEIQRMRIQMLKENSKNNLPLPHPARYVIPLSTLELKIELHSSESEKGKFKLVGIPLNAETIQNRNIDLSITSSLKMDFALLPGEEITPAPSEVQSALTKEEVINIVTEKLNPLYAKEELVSMSMKARYRRDSRKWSVELMDGPDAFAILIIDDSTGRIIGDIIYMDSKIPDENIMPLGPPVITSVYPLEASTGDEITVKGDNLFGLNISQTDVTFGSESIVPSEWSLKQMRFKVDKKMTSGKVKVIIPNIGSVESENQVLIRATPKEIIPSSGYFDPVTRTGSVLKVTGANIAEETQLEFTGGARTSPQRVESPEKAWFRVPENARNGPVALISHGIRMELTEPVFFLRPLIKKVKPKEAKAKENIYITGNHFEEVTGIKIGSRNFLFNVNKKDVSSTKAIISDQILVIEIPDNAGDGLLSLIVGQTAFETGVIFYQVPAVTDLPDFAIRNKVLEIEGTGFGDARESLNVRFQVESGYTISKILSLEDLEKKEENRTINRGKKRIRVKVPENAVSGPITVIRAEILCEKEFNQTTGSTPKKLLVWKEWTSIEEIEWCSPNWEGSST